MEHQNQAGAKAIIARVQLRLENRSYVHLR
jgi:hypothetical protein